MKKYLCLLILIILSSFLLTSCGRFGVDTKQIKADLALRDEVQNCYNSELTTPTEYHVKDLEIIKEQSNKDSKQDLICGNATVENEYFSVNFNMEAVYDYFDKGGWIMNKLTLSDIQVTAIALPNLENIEAALCQSYDDDSIAATHENGPVTLDYGHLTLTEAEFFDMAKEYENRIANTGLYHERDLFQLRMDYIQNNNIAYAKLNAKYTSPVLEVNGYYYMAFVDNEWRFSYMSYEDPNSDDTDNADDIDNVDSSYGSVALSLDKYFYITDYKSDYSQAVGTYKLFPGIEESTLVSQWNNKNKGDITIHNVTDKTIELTLNYELVEANISDYDLDLTGSTAHITTTAAECYLTVPTGERTTQDSNALEGTLVISQTSGKPGYLKYDPISNAWHSFGTGDQFCQSDDAMISMTVSTVQFISYGSGSPSYEYYIDDELEIYNSLRVSANGNGITVKDAIETAIDNSINHLSHFVHDYSEDGKRLINAYGFKEKYNGDSWRCYINGELLSLDDYCNHPVEYGDELKLVYVYNSVPFENIYYGSGYYEQFGIYLDEYVEQYGKYPFDVHSFDKDIYNAIYSEK